jgi:predicted ArsR family transcriptional regulator
MTDVNDVPAAAGGSATVADAELDLNRDVFMRTLMRELSGTLQDLVGIEEASGFISIVGKNVGNHLNASYRNAMALENLDRSTVADVLVDLKRRINGSFSVIEETADKIVFGNKACPFGDKVKERPSLCMMTSNVFGTITAANLGYAKVALEETIANGDPGCKVTVYIRPTDEAEDAQGREYFGK